MPKKKCKVPRSLRGYREWSLEIIDWILEFELPVIMIFGLREEKSTSSSVFGFNAKEKV